MRHTGNGHLLNEKPVSEKPGNEKRVREKIVDEKSGHGKMPHERTTREKMTNGKTTYGNGAGGFGSRPVDHRALLLSVKRDVVRDLGVQLENAAAPGRVADDDLALVNHDQFVNGRLNKLDYDRLRLINEALDRIDAGDYGTCQRCEDSIAARRLEVIPWAKYCVQCQEKLSRREEDHDTEVPQSVW